MYYFKEEKDKEESRTFPITEQVLPNVVLPIEEQDGKERRG